MRLFGRRDRMTLGEQLEIEDLVVDAFRPLRSRGASVSAARVHAVVRWQPRVEAAHSGGLALLPRLTESSLALALMAFVFAGSVGAPAPPSADAELGTAESEPRVHVSRPLDDDTFIRWVRIGRTGRIFDDLDPSAGVQQVHAEDTTAPAVITERRGRSF